uniref:Uncharacterized protein n=1 Tax=Chromera velia CCMP2878 TaxID=1169474 RepID=A0A0G4HDF2_9ALVE|eukprot:Cvel_26500.t1-p1 / transcript=Cvel_26500.t1 / gene=Cvel_26500 / organism=Chromera_velia_CCMP2878 / gene_product=hypothetical protein / transcript_product=hypothetical protein / location=Cvel_scaffold3160:10585-11667(+) / protein_length=361 / sequence_SO=supercontig / SO=protein_coding / is_pseudo=false
MADPQGSGSAQEAQQEAGDQSKPGGEDGRRAGHADASDDAEVTLKDIFRSQQRMEKKMDERERKSKENQDKLNNEVQGQGKKIQRAEMKISKLEKRETGRMIDDEFKARERKIGDLVIRGFDFSRCTVVTVASITDYENERKKEVLDGNGRWVKQVAFPQQRKDFWSFAPVRLFFSDLAEAAGKENPSQVSQQLQIRHFRYWTERDGGHKAEITLDSGDRGDWMDIVDSVKEKEGVNRDGSIFWPPADSSSLSTDERASMGRVFIHRGTTPLFRLFVRVQKALDAEVGGEASFAQQALISKYAQVYQDWNAATKGLKGERVVTRRLYEFLQEWQTGLPNRGERDGNDEREGRGRDPVLKGS